MIGAGLLFFLVSRLRQNGLATRSRSCDWFPIAERGHSPIGLRLPPRRCGSAAPPVEGFRARSAIAELAAAGWNSKSTREVFVTCLSINRTPPIVHLFVGHYTSIMCRERHSVRRGQTRCLRIADPI